MEELTTHEVLNKHKKEDEVYVWNGKNDEPRTQAQIRTFLAWYFTPEQQKLQIVENAIYVESLGYIYLLKVD